MYPSEKWKKFFTLGDLEARGVALRVVCGKCKRRTDIQPSSFAGMRRRYDAGDAFIAAIEPKLKCSCGARQASVTATESWAMMGR